MANIENRENLYGMNIPRGSFALSGGQFAESMMPINGKLPTDGPPIIITDSPPGVFSSEWIRTFGASRDAYLTIINGKFLQSSIEEMTIAGIYRDGSVNAVNDNLWKHADTPYGTVQQVQYIASKDTIDEASAATETFGEIEEARGIGLRIPTIAGGYGRTIDGLPTDPEPSEDGGGRRNDETHKVARETWKYGPIEYRWDYRRGVWSAYNELIADHEGNGMGTWVFSTNPDSFDGFPFLRGKLEDVWWIRKPHELDGQNGKLAGTKTGEIMTHLEHRWYDDNEKACAKLSSIFIIPHEESASEDGDDSGCHFKAENEGEVGDEKTASAERIDIRHDVHFFKEKGVDGPIKMEKKFSEIEDKACCINPDSKYFFGEMIFLDEPIEYCSVGEALPVVEKCHWVPAIRIDECELMGKHMVKLVTNDMKLGGRLSDICNVFSDYTQNAAGVSDANMQSISARLDCLNNALQALAVAVTAAIAVSIEELGYQVQDEFVKSYEQMNELAAKVQQALAICGCEVNIDFDASLDSFGHSGFTTPEITADSCPPSTFSRFPSIDCADVCFGVDLEGPCTTQPNFIAGRACGPFNPYDIDTSEGTCGTHED